MSLLESVVACARDAGRAIEQVAASTIAGMSSRLDQLSGEGRAR